MKRPVLIISHRRSGTHFLWEALKLNFKVSTSYDHNNQLMYFKVHMQFSNGGYEKLLGKRTCIYLLRDARDTLVSNYYYWKAGREPDFGVEEIFRELTFSQYIHGEAVNVGKKMYGEDFNLPGMFSDPINHWLSYTGWADKIFTVKFEDLKNDFDKSMLRIGEYIGRSVREGNVKRINKLVGHVPRKGIVGDWKNHFSEKDLEYFWGIAGQRMTELGYAKQDVFKAEEIKPVVEEHVLTEKKPVISEGWFKRLIKRVKGWFK